MENPYAPPLADPVALKRQARRKTFRQLWPILILGPLVGAVVGGLINSINGAVSPDYFAWVMDWEDNIWLRSILQGMLEGLAWGLGNAIVFLMAALFFVMDEVRLAQILRLIGAIASAVIVLSFIAAFISAVHFFVDPLSSQLYVENRISFGGAINFAWVKGSILGACYSGPFTHGSFVAGTSASAQETSHDDRGG